MDDKTWNGVIFFESIDDCDFAKYGDQVLHILCTSGCMSFEFQDVHYNIVPGDYVILPYASLASRFWRSADLQVIIMSLSESFINSMAIRSNYGIIGHLSLLQNPVMKLSERDFENCRSDLLRIKDRIADDDHLFRNEMINNLLIAHILDLYNIHAQVRNKAQFQVPERAVVLMRRFIEMLYCGEYKQNRDLSYYASHLCVTPHYLSDVCNKVSDRPASFWIDRFTMLEINRLLHHKELSLSKIAEMLNFSSLSYFSRYVQKRNGVSPSVYRNSFSDKR